MIACNPSPPHPASDLQSYPSPLPGGKHAAPLPRALVQMRVEAAPSTRAPRVPLTLPQPVAEGIPSISSIDRVLGIGHNWLSITCLDLQHACPRPWHLHLLPTPSHLPRFPDLKPEVTRRRPLKLGPNCRHNTNNTIRNHHPKQHWPPSPCKP